MMVIIDKAQLTLVRLKKVRALRDGIDEAKALEGLRIELEKLAEPIKSLAGIAKILISEGVSLTPVVDVSSAIETVNNISNRFDEKAISSTLKQGTRWTGLIKKLDKVATNVKETQAKDWETFFDNNFFSGAPPEKRKATLAPTPENEKAFKVYRALFQNFIKYRTQFPKDTDEFKSLQETSEQLFNISNNFQENVPDAVRKFFEATSSGAELDLLTNEVLDWLRNNNLLSNYVVRAKYGSS